MFQDKTNDKYRVGIYLRLSNEDRDKSNELEESESIKNQRNMLLDYIDKHPEFIFVKEYCDEDLSGAGTYRPEFEKLIKDCENRKLDVILCKSQSRFSRDMEVVERYINNKFIEWNIRFIGISDNADTNILGNKKARQINGLVNEWYLEDVSANIRSAFLSKMKKGQFISPFAAYGYEISKLDNNKLVIDPVAAKTVQDIFFMYLYGLGFTAIANHLNIKKVPSPSLYKYRKGCKLNITSKKLREEIKWNANGIKTILTNQLYLGHLVQGKRTTISYKNHKIITKPKEKWIMVKHTHDAIIDEEIFFKVQKLIRERKRKLKKTNAIYSLSGKVFCNECGHVLRKKDSQKHEYLVCSNIYNENNKCKNKSSIRYDELERIILYKIKHYVNKYYDETFLLKHLSDRKNKLLISKITLLESEKKEVLANNLKINSYLQELYEDKVNGLITIEQFEKLLNIYNNNIKEVKDKIKLIDNEIFNCKEKLDSLNCNEILQKYKRIDKLNRVIIQEFVDKIYVGSLNKEASLRDVIIKWNFLEFK